MGYSPLLEAVLRSGLMSSDESDRSTRGKYALVNSLRDEELSPYGTYRSVSVRSYSVSKDANLE